MPRFAAHGDARMDVQGRVLVFRPQGPGNREEIERLMRELGAVLPGLGGAAWAALLIANAETLLTLDAEQSLAAHAAALVGQGQRGFAIALLDGSYGSLFEAQFGRVYAGTGCPVRLFHNEAEARDWLLAISA